MSNVPEEVPAAPDASSQKIHHWNYRVLERPVDDAVEFSLIEVYYDARDEILMWGEAGSLLGDSLADLEAEAALRHLAAQTALMKSPHRRVLTLADLPAVGDV